MYNSPYPQFCIHRSNQPQIENTQEKKKFQKVPCIRCFKYSTGDLQYRDDICWLDAKTVSSYIRDLASSGCGIPRGPETNSPGIPRDDPVCKKKLVLLRQLNGLLRNPPRLLIS